MLVEPLTDGPSLSPSFADRAQGLRGWLSSSMANEEDDPVVQEVTAALCPLPPGLQAVELGPCHASSGQSGIC